MSIKSDMGPQENNFLLPYKMGNTFHDCPAVFRNHAFFLKSICDSFEWKNGSKSMQQFPWIIIVDFPYPKYISKLPDYQAILNF